MPVEPDLRDLELYCDTDLQRRQVAAAQKHGNVHEASVELGIAYRNLQRNLARLRSIRDATEGGAPLPGRQFLLPGQKLRGLSALIRTEDGEPVWLKTEEDKQQAQEELAAMLGAFRDALPREKAVKQRTTTTVADLLNLFLITDYHMGMKAWWEEGGANWDTKIAEDMIYRWFASAIRAAPKASIALLAQLGDWNHWDGIEAVTVQNKNVLDVDTRFQKLIRVTIRVFRRIIRELLKTHDRVHIVMAEGNHDPASSMWLREIFRVFYEDEPRVTVDRSADPYYCYEFGNVSLFFHHGHKRKPNNIDDVFVSKFRPIFGRTEFSYGHMGHLHHDKVLETFLMHIEQHQTLAAPDAYASRGGWMSGRSAKVITYNKNHGEVRRETITPEML